MNKILMTGDCIEKMKCISDNSIDAVVTDPPYGLEFMGKEWDKFATLESFSEKEKGGFGGMKTHVRYGKDTKTFQGFTESWATECLRVLKPGAFLLSFGGTRTQHRLVCGIEDAGFEIRDMITWNYFTGFPKSHNIGKAIDKLQGTEHPKKIPISKNNSMSGPNYTRNKINVKNKLAKEWEGWGTALKPAMETICVARKPLSEKTNALNVLKWGTGGINIDECRVKTNDEIKVGFKDDRGSPFIDSDKHKTLLKDSEYKLPKQGRFPANTIFDEEAGKMLDGQSGVSKSKEQLMGTGIENIKNANVYGKYMDIKSTRGHNDKGGASRFFYCPKPSKAERNRGCEEMPIQEKDNRTDKGKGSFVDKGLQPSRNSHPTVKPINLMKYLIKLVSKENAIVLDPFLGSGTTGIAALELKRQFIGIEKGEDYMKIAKARIKTVTK